MSVKQRSVAAARRHLQLALTRCQWASEHPKAIRYAIREARQAVEHLEKALGER